MGGHVTGSGHSVEHPWGWLVTAAAFIVHILTFGVSWSTGVLNAIFLDIFDAPALDISWVGTLILGNMLISCSVAALIVDRYGYRITTFIGGIMMSAGLIVSYFAPNVYFLYVSLGVVTGVGGGIAFLPSITAVTHYFDRRRSLALGITSAGLGFGQFLISALIRWLYQLYDWRGVLLILGGITLNLCACGAIFRPLPVRNSQDKDKVKHEQQRHHHHQQQQQRHERLQCVVFRNYGYICMCVNNVMLSLGLSIIFIHLPAYGESVGIEENKSAFLMSVLGIANLAGRIAYGVIDHYLKNRSCELYACSFAVAGIVVLVVPASHNYSILVTLAVLFGFFTGCFGILLAQIVAKLVGLRPFAAAYGYLLMFEGLGTYSGGPLAGLLYDLTRKYDASMYISGSCLVLSSVLVIIPCLQIRVPKPGPQIEVEEEKTPMNGHKTAQC